MRERKRGKLADLNLLLREGNDEGFSLIVGATAVLAGVKYVITLDTDTQLPRDAARQFVGTMAHPLNRPVYDETLRRVRAGYGILQPRVSASLPGINLSRYAHLHGGEAGIDPIPASSPTSIRTPSRKARSSARASTTSRRSSSRSRGAFPRTASSATTCWKAVTPAPA
ncbi:MAG: hypothetical protein M5R42_17835 [Rhodocyclaceae bacterium]|nr:hypothetical protein [Rhodocyclaceae bacterium]